MSNLTVGVINEMCFSVHWCIEMNFEKSANLVFNQGKYIKNTMHFRQTSDEK